MKFYLAAIVCGLVAFICGPFLMAFCIHELAPVFGPNKGDSAIQIAYEVFLLVGAVAGIAMTAGGVAAVIVSAFSMFEDYLK